MIYDGYFEKRFHKERNIGGGDFFVVGILHLCSEE